MGKIIEKTVGAFDAKTHLSEILEKVQKGLEFTITKHGKPIAKIVPIKNKQNDLDYILKEFENIRKSVKGKVNIKSYINEGRKY